MSLPFIDSDSYIEEPFNAGLVVFTLLNLLVAPITVSQSLYIIFTELQFGQRTHIFLSRTIKKFQVRQ